MRQVQPTNLAGAFVIGIWLPDIVIPNRGEIERLSKASAAMIKEHLHSLDEKNPEAQKWAKYGKFGVAL